jgi:glycopeptide antibiotics resistance protein
MRFHPRADKLEQANMAKQRLVINIRDTAGEQELARARSTIANWLVGLALLTVYFCGMFPFDFSLGFSGVFSELRDRFDFSIRDVWTAPESPEKLIFYMPLGFALASLLWARKNKRTQEIVARSAIAVAIIAAVATSVEILQVFLSRDPSLADIISKTIGGALGFGVFVFAGEPLVNRLARQWVAMQHLSDPRIFGAAAGIWLLATTLAPIAARNLGSLESWDPGYPVLIGNDTDGVHHWDGTVSNVWLSSNGLDDNEIESLLATPDPTPQLRGSLLMAYHLDGTGPYTDSTGNTGNLVWTPNFERGAISGTTQPSDLTGLAAVGRIGVPISEGWWLSTAKGAAAKASAQISQTQAFALVIDLAMHDLDHGSDWPRIFSISNNAQECNLQLLQDHQDLQLRLRSQANGDGGFDPELTVPGIFTDTLPQRLVVTCSHGQIRVETSRSGEIFSLQLMPDAWLVWRIFPSSFWHYTMNSSGQIVARAIYRVAALLPLGVLLGAIVRVFRRRGRTTKYNGAIIGAICAAALLLEGSLHFAAGTPISIALPIIGLLAGGVGVAIILGHSSLRRRPF